MGNAREAKGTGHTLDQLLTPPQLLQHVTYHPGPRVEFRGPRVANIVLWPRFHHWNGNDWRYQDTPNG